ncbi:MAG: protease HtpX [Rhabdochlamydiaceae bacterium]|nr:protease HtpX [Candidatus Amphrikana amoebophyrae]
MFSLFKRISLFLVVNALIIFTVSMIVQIFNLQPYLNQRGINYQTLLIFCTIWGMGGAFISLALSKKMAKWMMGVKILEENSFDSQANMIHEIVAKQARQLGIPKPEVGIFQSQAPNAFATGPSRSNSLVALSSSLINLMDEKEVEAIIGHEMAHIANGDMVTMTLLQGVINAFVMFLARILAQFFASSRDNRNGRSSFGAYFMFTILFEMAFMVLGSIALCGFSRWREFRADKGGAQLAGKENMISALRKLESLSKRGRDEKMPEAVQALMISPVKGSLLMKLFSTHPSIERRVERLKTQF